jgi:hypothetical protein
MALTARRGAHTCYHHYTSINSGADEFSVLQELSDDGAVLAVALNAVSAALTDAGISLKYTFGRKTPPPLLKLQLVC